MTVFNRLVFTAALAVLFASAFAAPAAQAQSTPTIGYTDYELIIVQMPEYRTLQQTLQAQAQKDQQELAAQEQAIQQKFAEYQDQSGVLSPEARQTREQEIVQMQTDLQQDQQRRLQGLDRQQNELLQPLLEKLQVAIDEVATARGLQLVLSSRVSTEPVILFAGANTVDVTAEVMSKLGISMTQSEGAAPTGAN
ncbi:MAG: OmpH family outer membrane protein [Rhodothermales bacterium]